MVKTHGFSVNFPVNQSSDTNLAIICYHKSAVASGFFCYIAIEHGPFGSLVYPFELVIFPIVLPVNMKGCHQISFEHNPITDFFSYGKFC